MPKKLTHEEFVKQIYDLYGNEFKVVSKYVNSRTKIEVYHEKCGKTHMKSPDGLKRGKGCPYCADYSQKNSKKIKMRTHDDFMKEVFDLVENEYTVLGEYVNSKTKVKMIHNICGNEIYPIPHEFINRGTRCAYCEDKSRRMTHIEFVDRIKSKRNNEFCILGKYKNNKTHILVKHKKCNQTYEVLPKNLLNGTKCPFCSNTRSNKETFKRELKNTVGDEYILIGDYINKSTKVSLVHNVCGNVYETTPVGFLKSGYRCPKCTNKKMGLERRKSHKKFVSEIKDLYGNEFLVVSKYITSHDDILVKHNTCGNIINTKPYKMLSFNMGCKYCNQSLPESVIQRILNENNIENISQYKFNKCVGKSGVKLPFDFALFKNQELVLVLEYDGEHHEKEEVFGKESHERTVVNDKIKNKYCKSNGINLERISYRDKNNLPQVLNKILEKYNLI